MAMILREAAGEGTAPATPPADTPAEPATDAAPATPAADPAATDAPKSLLSGDDDTAPVAEEPLTAESFTLAEGRTLDEAQLTPFLEIMNTADLTRAELAQKLVDYQVSSQQTAGEAADEAATSMWNATHCRTLAALRCLRLLPRSRRGLPWLAQTQRHSKPSTLLAQGTIPKSSRFCTPLPRACPRPLRSPVRRPRVHFHKLTACTRDAKTKERDNGCTWYYQSNAARRHKINGP